MRGELLEAARVHSVVGAFYTVHNYFGYGLREFVYATALDYELSERGHQVTRELAIPVSYKGRHVAWQRIDRVVDNAVIVEIKATEKLSPADKPQIITYLRASPYQVGVLLHFGPRAKFYRVIDYPKRPSASVAPSSSSSSISSNSCPNGLGPAAAEEHET